MAKLITIYWRDIPAQVIGKQGRTNFKKVLSDRFAVAIDRAAMRAGKGSSDAYLEEWRRVIEPVSGDLQAIVDEQAASLEAAFSDEDLDRIARAKGIADS